MFKIRKNYYTVTGFVAEDGKVLLSLRGPEGYMIFNRLELELDGDRLFIILPGEKTWRQKKKEQPAEEQQQAAQNGGIELM